MTDVEGLLVVARAELLVPPTILVALAFLFRHRLARPASFVVFAELAFLGIAALIGDVLIHLPVSMVGASIEDQVMHGLAIVHVRSVMLAMVVSIPVVRWLYLLFRRSAA